MFLLGLTSLFPSVTGLRRGWVLWQVANTIASKVAYSCWCNRDQGPKVVAGTSYPTMLPGPWVAVFGLCGWGFCGRMPFLSPPRQLQKCRTCDSNPGAPDYEAGALPLVLANVTL